MRKIFLLFTLLGMNVLAFSQGKFSVKSSYDFEQTVLRVKNQLAEKGITIFAEIDHSGEAKKVGMDLAPTKLLVVGNPKLGTQLMQENQEVALHLPLKILILERAGKVEIQYQKIHKLSRKYKLKNTLKLSKKIDETLEEILKKSAF